jgi:hypothetical protein
MKKWKWITLASLFIFSASLGVAKHFWRGETMSAADIEKKWGKSSFDASRFKGGDYKVRASMAASLLSNPRKYIGVDRSIVREQLGDFDGFYFSDMFPTYIIELGKNHEEDTWQIVFVLGREEKVSDIIVHKNCCDR